MKWWACASLAASMIRGRVFIESPRPILTRTESVKTRSACKTVATWARTDSRVDVAEVVAVDQDAAGSGIEQPGDQADQGELGIFVLAHDGGAANRRGSRARSPRAAAGPTGSRARRFRTRSVPSRR